MSAAKPLARAKKAGPRYSITAGDFWRDQRAKLAHFRVYNYLGSYTDKNGWFTRRMRQDEHAAEIGMGRQRYNEALNDLCSWGYVAREERSGRVFYRVMLDRGEPPE